MIPFLCGSHSQHAALSRLGTGESINLVRALVFPFKVEAEYGLKGNSRALHESYTLKGQETPWVLSEYRPTSFITHCFIMLPVVALITNQGEAFHRQKDYDLLCCGNRLAVVV